MKALFVTTQGHESVLVFNAWESLGRVGVQYTFDPWGTPDDVGILAAARKERPDVIFYIGANKASGLPSLDTFKKMKDTAPLVHLCWDAACHTWHDVLRTYDDCFTLQVSMDAGGHTDLSTLTPIDPRPYDRPAPKRSIRCAFAGQAAVQRLRPRRMAPRPTVHPRWSILTPLMERGVVTFRPRSDSGYPEYARYLQSCQMLLNISHTGSGEWHHCKLRITEAGYAGCALLEMAEAPTRNWVPEEALFIYRNVNEAEDIIHLASDDEIATKAGALTYHIKQNHSPEAIFGRILDLL